MNCRLNILRPVLIGCAVMIGGCRPNGGDAYLGYLEGEYVYMSAPAGGALEELSVRRGDSVTRGQALFQLEEDPERAALENARARLAQAESELANRQKGLRPSELEALEAELRRLETEHRLAVATLQRHEAANAGRAGSVSEQMVDRSRTEVAALEAQAAQVRAQVVTGRLGAREDEIRMAAEAVEGARAEVARAEWLVGEKGQAAPAEAYVQDTLFRVGEYVPAGGAVVSLLPPGNLLVRFFVPEPELARLRVGDGVEVSWDGIAGSRRATIRYVSTRAEYTPPVIYSQTARAKLVFLVEATFAEPDPAVMKVGQPVEVRLAGAQDE